MADQGNLFSPHQKPAAVAPVSPDRSYRSIPRWLAVLELSLFVLLRFYVGAWVVLLPWGGRWTTSAWLLHFPMLAAFIAQGWVRGIVSGLGLLNIWVAFVTLFRGDRR